jgi:hypothetical protein
MDCEQLVQVHGYVLLGVFCLETGIKVVYTAVIGQLAHVETVDLH